jgi:hypothetical protein
MSSLGLLLTVLGSSTAAGTAFAAPIGWKVAGPATRAMIAGGPWVLSQGASAFPTPNPGMSPFQPYYQAHTMGSDSVIEGYFDYRPKDKTEGIVSARSTDGGKTWAFQSQVLAYTPPAAKPNDDGEGHPYVLSAGGRTFLYTLDRSAAAVDNMGLIVRMLAPSPGDPLAGVSAVAQQGVQAPQRTVGLTNPDGIIDVVPGSGGSQATRVLYLEKEISVTPNVVTVHLAETTDGVNFTNDQMVKGLTSAAVPFIAPRGTLLKFSDGHYGLFFSAGLQGEDADAFHFVGYAESPDLVTWTIVNGVDHPLLSIDGSKDPTGGQPWYAGRVYAPSVTLSADGKHATMMFSGYKTTKPKDAPDDYRQIGTLSLTIHTNDAPADGGASSGAADGGAVDMGPKVDTSDGCNVGMAGSLANGLTIALCLLLAAALRGRRRHA